MKGAARHESAQPLQLKLLPRGTSVIRLAHYRCIDRRRSRLRSRAGVLSSSEGGEDVSIFNPEIHAACA